MLIGMSAYIQLIQHKDQGAWVAVGATNYVHAISPAPMTWCSLEGRKPEW